MIDNRATDISVYEAIADKVVNRRSVLLGNFVLNGKESASNPLLHIHAKRATGASAVAGILKIKNE